MVLELKFKLQHYCTFTEFSKNNYGKRRVLQYCGNEIDYLVLPSPVTEEIMNNGYYIFPPNKNMRIFGDGSTSGLVTLKCTCKDPDTGSIVSKIFKLGGNIIYPIIYENGYEQYKVLCQEMDDVTNIVNDLNKRVTFFEIISMIDIGQDSLLRQSVITSQVLENLTEKQLDILIKAFEKGYYQIPRNIRIKDIADELQLTRHAVERTLRGAENKLLINLMPYLYIKKYGTELPDIPSEILEKSEEKV